MKKLTSALAVAAAMGVSASALAAPDFSGRVNILYKDTTGFNDSNGRLQIFDSGEGVNGIQTGYFIRLNGNSDGASNVAKAYVTVAGDFGKFLFGREDDLVYQMVGGNTDPFRGFGLAAFSATGKEGTAVQYHLTVDMVTLAAYADTGKDNDVGIYEVGGSLDLGAGSVSVVFADGDSVDSGEVYVGATLDAGVAQLAASVGDLADGSQPYGLSAGIPLTDSVKLTIGYADDDAGNANAVGEFLFQLGGGVSMSAGYQGGDAEDFAALGVRYSF